MIELEDLLKDHPAPELSKSLAMLLRDFFHTASAENMAKMARADGPPSNVYEVKEDRSPLIGLYFDPALLQTPPYDGVDLDYFFHKWTDLTAKLREEHSEQEDKRLGESSGRLQPRPFHLRYELYSDPKYAAVLAKALAHPDDDTVSVYFRSEDPEAEVSWNWPLRVGCLRQTDSERLHDKLRSYVEKERYWLSDLVELVLLDSETDGCDILLFPQDLNAALASVSDLGIKISADCVLIVGDTNVEPESMPFLIDEFRRIVSTGGVGIAAIRDSDLSEWFTQLVRELSHNESIDTALFTACRRTGTPAPFLAASRKLIEFSKLAESIKSLGEKLISLPEDAPPIEIESHDAHVFGIDPGIYHPKDLGKVFTADTENFMFDEEVNTGRSAAKIDMAERSITRSAQPGTTRSAKPKEKPVRRIQARVFDHSDEDGRRKELTRALRVDAMHKALVRIGFPEEGWIQNTEEFKPEGLSDKETYHLMVVFTEPQLFPDPLVSFIDLPPGGNSSECEFLFRIPKNVEKIEARISIVYKNRVLQTALLKAQVVIDPLQTDDRARVEVVPEANVRADFSGLKQRRNFEGAFILNHDANHISGVTAIRDKYVAFSPLGDLDKFVAKVDEFLTKIADYPDEYTGGLKAAATVTLMSDLAMHGRMLYKTLAEFPRGNMSDVFSSLSQSGAAKATQRIQIISANPNTRLPMEFLYDRKAPATSDAKLCPRAIEALNNDGCFTDCDGIKDPENHVCPMGFWGLTRIIERHTYNPLDADKVDGSFRFQSEPVEGRKHLDIFRGVLFGASNRADISEVTAPDGTVTAKKGGGISKIVSVLDTIAKSRNHKVSSWTEWRDKIGSDPPPTTLLLLTHTEKSGTVPALEIEDGVLVGMQSIEEDYVYSRRDPVPPVVLLIGCETGAADIEFINFVAKFRQGGAAIIVSTGSPIRGRHAIPVTEELLKQLDEFTRKPHTSFGEVMRIVKQKVLAQGYPMVLTLMTYGDADWQIGMSDT